MISRLLVSVLLAVTFVLPAVSASAAQCADIDQDTPITIHVVQRGDNLFRISQHYGVSVDDIAFANGIANPGSIQVGQRLIIPIGGIRTEPVEPLVHVIQPGDNLTLLANRYEVTLETLLEWNDLTAGTTLFVGQSLIVSEGGKGFAGTRATGGGEEVVAETTVTHIIHRGETLFTIANMYGVSMDALQTANEIEDTSRIYAGQELLIPGVTGSAPSSQLPEPVSSVSINPLILIEGQSASIHVTTTHASVVTSEFLGTLQNVVSDESRTQHTMLVAIPVYTESGVYLMILTITPDTGPVVTLPLNIQIRSGNYGNERITLPDDRMGLLSSAVEENEYSLLRNITETFNPQRFFTGAMSLPAAAVMNARFGTRRSYNGGEFDRYHQGADFAGAPGTPVLAAAPGRVVLADTLHIRGVSVLIDHGWGVFTNYSHMAERYVHVGDFVQTGQVIGIVGNTGRATGAHLHWELWLNGIPVDPMQWVRQIFP